MNEALIELFGESWVKVLGSYLHSGSFHKLGSEIAKERKLYTVYPTREYLFRCFRLTPYDSIKVVIIGQDPYHDGSADGLAFSNGECVNTSPSLRNILKEIDSEFPEDINDISAGRLVRDDLSRWAFQGVLLINAAQTVIEKKPGSHMKLWEGFTKKILEIINAKNDVIWILLGKEAQNIYKLSLFGIQDNPSHYVLTAPHPAAEIYSGGQAGFFGSNVFRLANEELEKRNIKPIKW